MGQKLEKPSEKDEESSENPDGSDQTGETEQAKTAERDESRHQDNGSSGELNVSGQATGQVRELTLPPARTDPQIGQPIRLLGQRERTPDTRRERVGGDRESQSVAGTAGETKTVPSPKETRQTPNKQRSSGSEAAVCTGTAAMEEHGNEKKSGLGQRKVAPAATCDPITEEDFVMLDDETLMSSEGENNGVCDARIRAENPRSFVSRRAEEDASSRHENNLPRPSRNVLQERGTKATSGGKADTLSIPTEGVEAHGNSLPSVGLERETGQRLAEVTGSRCRLKGVSYVGAASTGTTGEAERVQNLSERGKEPKAASDFGVDRQKTQDGEDSLPAEDDSQDFSQATKTAPHKLPSSEIPLEHSDLLPCPPLLGGRDGEVEKQIACLKRESEFVCFSAVITPPPFTHWLPERDAPEANSHKEPDATPEPCGSEEAPVLREKSKVKGPPPPVPKKPKNPFVKLKTAQLFGDVQRRGKDHLRSEEKVRRRHTFHFNKDTPRLATRNQDMCVLWDERGTYTVPSGKRPLSVDLSPWEQTSLECMDDQYGDMMDFDYCARMGKLSPDMELQDLDMMQRRIFFERRSRFRSSPPPVARKPLNPFASTETLHVPDNDIHKPHPARLEKRGVHPEIRSKRVSPKADVGGSCDNRESAADYRASRDAGSGSEVGSYKPVSEIVKEKNQLQRNQGRVKPEGVKAQVRVAEQSPSVRVSQMKNAFDVPKKSKERPPEVQSSPKRGKDFVDILDISLLTLAVTKRFIKAEKNFITI